MFLPSSKINESEPKSEVETFGLKEPTFELIMTGVN